MRAPPYKGQTSLPYAAIGRHSPLRDGVKYKNGKIGELTWEDLDEVEADYNDYGVLFGDGERVGILVDMDEGWLSYYRDGELLFGPQGGLPTQVLSTNVGINLKIYFIRSYR